VGGVVAAWLAPFYAVEGVPRLMTDGLPPHAVLINREGHQFSRFGVSFHAPDPADTGSLRDSVKSKPLEADARGRGDSIGEKRAQLSALERSLAEHDGRSRQAARGGAALKQRHHERQWKTSSCSKGGALPGRSRQIDGELA